MHLDEITITYVIIMMYVCLKIAYIITIQIRKKQSSGLCGLTDVLIGETCGIMLENIRQYITTGQYRIGLIMTVIIIINGLNTIQKSI